MNDDLITTRQAAAIIGVSVMSIRRWREERRPWALTRHELPAPPGTRGDSRKRVFYSRTEAEALKASGRVFKPGRHHNNPIDTRSDIT